MKFNRVLAAMAIMMVSLAAHAQGASTSDPSDPKDIVQQNSEKIHALVMDSKTDEEMRNRVKALMDGFVDFEEFGKLALGSHWDKITPVQRTTYLVEFKGLLQRTYLRRFKAGREFKLEYRGQTGFNKAGDRAEVKTILTSKDVTADVDYRFHKTSGWKVYDIVVDEVSIMRNSRKSFTKVIDKDGFDKLIEKMRKKTSESLDDEKDELD